MKEELQDVDQIKKAFASGGLEMVHNYLHDRQDEWKKVPINIAVIGISGVGKSSFINAFRNVRRGEPEFAEEDVIEATTKPTAYRHPEHPNLVLWDLPGVGTGNFPKKTYIDKIGFDKYDFFLLLSSLRFSENDHWLAREIVQREKRFFFIRTQIDIDVLKRGDITAAEVVEKVRDNCIVNLKGIIPDVEKRLFIISNKNTSEFDFGQLIAALLETIPEEKRMALTLSMTLLTEGVINEKKKTLKEQIYLAALASAATVAIPLPGVGTAVDVAVLRYRVSEYRKQFGLDDVSLRRLGKALNTSAEDLMRKLQLTSTAYWSASGIMGALTAKSRSGKTLAKFPAYLNPLVGGVIMGVASFMLCFKTLEEVLDEVAEDALKVNKELVRKQTEGTLKARL